MSFQERIPVFRVHRVHRVPLAVQNLLIFNLAVCRHLAVNQRNDFVSEGILVVMILTTHVHVLQMIDDRRQPAEEQVSLRRFVVDGQAVIGVKK